MARTFLEMPALVDQTGEVQYGKSGLPRRNLLLEELKDARINGIFESTTIGSQRLNITCSNGVRYSFLMCIMGALRMESVEDIFEKKDVTATFVDPMYDIHPFNVAKKEDASATKSADSKKKTPEADESPSEVHEALEEARGSSTEATTALKRSAVSKEATEPRMPTLQADAALKKSVADGAMTTGLPPKTAGVETTVIEEKTTNGKIELDIAKHAAEHPETMDASGGNDTVALPHTVFKRTADQDGTNDQTDQIVTKIVKDGARDLVQEKTPTNENVTRRRTRAFLPVNQVSSPRTPVNGRATPLSSVVTPGTRASPLVPGRVVAFGSTYVPATPANKVEARKSILRKTPRADNTPAKSIRIDLRRNRVKSITPRLVPGTLVSPETNPPEKAQTRAETRRKSMATGLVDANAPKAGANKKETAKVAGNEVVVAVVDEAPKKRGRPPKENVVTKDDGKSKAKSAPKKKAAPSAKATRDVPVKVEKPKGRKSVAPIKNKQKGSSKASGSSKTNRTKKGKAAATKRK